MEPDTLSLPNLYANYYTGRIGKENPQHFQLTDTEIYVIMGDYYEKSREGQISI